MPWQGRQRDEGPLSFEDQTRVRLPVSGRGHHDRRLVVVARQSIDRDLFERARVDKRAERSSRTTVRSRQGTGRRDWRLALPRRRSAGWDRHTVGRTAAKAGRTAGAAAQRRSPPSFFRAGPSLGALARPPCLVLSREVSLDACLVPFPALLCRGYLSPRVAGNGTTHIGLPAIRGTYARNQASTEPSWP